MALQAALACFAQAKRGISESNSLLLASHIQAVRDLIKEAFGGGGGTGLNSKRAKRWVKWDSENLEDWTSQFSAKVNSLQDKVDDVNSKIKLVEVGLEQLKQLTGAGVNTEPRIVLGSLQAVVDDMQMRGFSNMSVWVQVLDKRVEAIISMRLQHAVKAWVAAFRADGKTLAAVEKTDQGAITVTLDHTVHEILLSNQILYLSPPLEQARQDWIATLHAYIDPLHRFLDS
jgi:dynein heavy chain 1